MSFRAERPLGVCPALRKWLIKFKISCHCVFNIVAYLFEIGKHLSTTTTTCFVSGHTYHQVHHTRQHLHIERTLKMEKKWNLVIDPIPRIIHPPHSDFNIQTWGMYYRSVLEKQNSKFNTYIHNSAPQSKNTLCVF